MSGKWHNCWTMISFWKKSGKGTVTKFYWDFISIYKVNNCSLYKLCNMSLQNTYQISNGVCKQMAKYKNTSHIKNFKPCDSTGILLAIKSSHKIHCLVV